MRGRLQGKRRCAFLCMGLMLPVLLLSACSSQGEAPAAGSAAPVQTVQEQNGIPEEAQAVFYFRSGDAYLYPGLDVTVFPVLGETQTGYFEAESCAALGIDKTYVFPDFEITTYPDGETDRIRYIFFKTDLVQTAEGADLSMNRADITAIYGTDYETAGDAVVYRKGGTRLLFFFDDRDFVTSIEYRSGIPE